MRIVWPLGALLIAAFVALVFVCVSVALAIAVLAVEDGRQPEGLPDGVSGQVVFAGERNGEGGLYVSDLDTGEVKSITTGPGEYGYPAYSPTAVRSPSPGTTTFT